MLGLNKELVIRRSEDGSAGTASTDWKRAFAWFPVKVNGDLERDAPRKRIWLKPYWVSTEQYFNRKHGPADIVHRMRFNGEFAKADLPPPFSAYIPPWRNPKTFALDFSRDL